VRAFADIIRQAGHTVHLPDLYDGLFADSSLPSYVQPAADLLIQRVLAFLRA
jgi:hypothetical protein